MTHSLPNRRDHPLLRTRALDPGGGDVAANAECHRDDALNSTLYVFSRGFGLIACGKLSLKVLPDVFFESLSPGFPFPSRLGA
jgi:hypothetical protein